MGIEEKAAGSVGDGPKAEFQTENPFITKTYPQVVDDLMGWGRFVDMTFQQRERFWELLGEVAKLHE